MSIYAKKNRAGQPNGLWAVEITKAGKRHRYTAKSFREAQDYEKVIQAGDIPPDAPSPSMAVLARTSSYPAAVYTVRQLRREAQVVWATRKDKDQSIARFEAVCDILGDDTSLVTVRTSQLDVVVDTLRSRSLSNKTIHRYLASFSAALKWAVERDKLAGKPIIPWPTCGKGNDTVISEDDERRVLKRLQTVGSPDMAVVVDGLLATGCRISELLDLEPDDITDDEVTFRDTKNGDDRVVPVEPALAAKLKALSVVGFPTYRRVNTSLHSARKALGIKHKVTPHVLRHTVGTRLSAAGVEVPTIGKILGHRNLKTTMGYIHPEKASVMRAVKHLARNKEEA